MIFMCMEAIADSLLGSPRVGLIENVCFWNSSAVRMSLTGKVLQANNWAEYLTASSKLFFASTEHKIIAYLTLYNV